MSKIPFRLYVAGQHIPEWLMEGYGLFGPLLTLCWCRDGQNHVRPLIKGWPQIMYIKSDATFTNMTIYAYEAGP